MLIVSVLIVNFIGMGDADSQISQIKQNYTFIQRFIYNLLDYINISFLIYILIDIFYNIKFERKQ